MAKAMGLRGRIPKNKGNSTKGPGGGSRINQVSGGMKGQSPKNRPTK